jgi:tetratricopeptide (TPR) repeat protein
MTKPAALFLIAASIALVTHVESAAQDNETEPGSQTSHSDAKRKKQHQFLLHPETMISEATARIKEDPKDYSAYLHRGLGYWAAHDLDKAASDIKKSIELNPARSKKKLSTPQDKMEQHSLAHAYYQLGCVYCLQKQYQIGIDQLTEAITLDPNLSEAYRNRAVAYQTTGQTNLAQADFETAARLKKAHPDERASNLIEPELNRLVEINALGDEEDTARRLVATNLQIAKDKDVSQLARLRRHRVSLNYRLGRYKEALADLDWMQANDTTKPFWSTSRRQSLEGLLQKYGSSKRDFDPKLFSNDPNNELHEANNLVITNKLDPAETLLLGHVKSFPNDAMAYAILYSIHLNRNQIAKAIDDANNIIELDPTNRAVYIWRAEVNEKLHRYKEAIIDYSFVLSFDPKSEYTRSCGVPLDQGYFRRADDYRAIHQLDNAIADYTSILKLDPSEEEAFRFRGDCYFSKGRYELALADYTKSISLDSRSASNTYLARAKVYEAMKRVDLAKKDRSTAAELSLKDKTKTNTKISN